MLSKRQRKGFLENRWSSGKDLRPIRKSMSKTEENTQMFIACFLCTGLDLSTQAVGPWCIYPIDGVYTSGTYGLSAQIQAVGPWCIYPIDGVKFRWDFSDSTGAWRIIPGSSISDWKTGRETLLELQFIAVWYHWDMLKCIWKFPWGVWIRMKQTWSLRHCSSI